MRTSRINPGQPAMKTNCVTRRLATLGLLALVGLGAAACSDDLLTEVPQDIIVADNLYTNAAGFEAGLNALYAQVRKERNGYFDAGNNIVGVAWWVGVDNGWGNYLLTASRVHQELGSYNNSLHNNYEWMWWWLYQTINAANTIVNRAENPEVRWTEAEKNRVLAEARLFRAWAYRHLTYLWGDVPLHLEESSGENIRTDWVCAPKREVWGQMEEDLLFAEQHLPATSTRQGKVTKAVAQHYLAELYLAMGDAAKAEAKAAAVINSGLYKLITQRYGVRVNQPGVPFMDQFVDGNSNRSEGNTETLWTLQLDRDLEGGGLNIMRRYWVNRYYTLAGIDAGGEGQAGRGIGRLAPTKWALQLYEPQDERGSHYALWKFLIYNNAKTLPKGKKLGDTLWLKWDRETKDDPLWPSPRKWDWINPIDPTGGYQYNDQPYLRLAETYLLLAEAQFKQGKLAEAATSINALRSRAGAPLATAGEIPLDYLLDERSRELLNEEERRHTLVRTGTWLDRVKRYNPASAAVVTARDTIFPIPQAVIDANLTKPMAQNPGY